MLKRWALPILILYVVVLTVGSLSHVGVVPKLGSSFDDKINHFIAYAVLTFLLHNVARTRRTKSKLMVSAIIATLYGIIIEGLQAVLTDFRTPDYFDIIANTLGVIIMCLILLLIRKRKLK